MEGVKDMAETEKITINVDVVDLGKIDVLVDQGFYSTRTDCIKSAIRNELAKHDQIVTQYAVKKTYTFGITKLSKEELEQVVAAQTKLDVKVIGMLVVDEDVEPELMKRSVQSLKVHGVFKASPKIKSLY